MKKLLVFLGIMFLGSIVYAMTLTQIRTEIRRLTADMNTETTFQKWLNSELDIRINSVQDDICVQTLCLSTTYYITTSTGIREYTYPDGLLGIKRVSYLIHGTTYYTALEYKSSFELDITSTSWERDNLGGNPRYWYDIRQSIGLDPVPGSTHAGTNKLRIEYYKLANSLSNDSDVPFDGYSYMKPFHQLIAWKVAATCMSDERDVNFAALYEARYDKGILALIKFLETKQFNKGIGELKR